MLDVKERCSTWKGAKLLEDGKAVDIHLYVLFDAIPVYPSHDSKPAEAYFEEVTIKSLVFDISQLDLDSAGAKFLQELLPIINKPM
jgi:hypothetical protein